MAKITLKNGNLTAVVGDNAADEWAEHRAGYNGLWSLQHRNGSRSVYVPGIAGLNLEHIVSGEGERDREIFFEPRRSPMQLKVLSDTSAELYQAPTFATFLESWTKFELVAPDHVDMTFRCRPTQHVFSRNYLALFWASYINAPEDKSLYFRGALESAKSNGMWQQLCSPAHNRDSTVKYREDAFTMTFPEEAPDALYKSFSPLRFDQPFYYGQHDDQTLIYAFDRSEGIRFTHSPSGGGGNSALETTNPAWDFQYVIQNPKVATEYGFRMRATLRDRCSREEIDREVSSWWESLKAN